MTVTIRVCADKDDAVDERDETNNCRENEFKCPPCPRRIIALHQSRSPIA